MRLNYKAMAILLTGLLATSAMGADAPATQPSSKEAKTTTKSGLVIIEKGMPSKADVTAAPGDSVWVEYTGALKDGKKFDSSSDHPGQPLIFVLGQGQVIKGWDEGITGMKVGEKRKLIIPPTLGYGAHGAGPIPPNSTLIFDVQLLGLKKAS